MKLLTKMLKLVDPTFNFVLRDALKKSAFEGVLKTVITLDVLENIVAIKLKIIKKIEE